MEQLQGSKFGLFLKCAGAQIFSDLCLVSNYLISFASDIHHFFMPFFYNLQVCWCTISNFLILSYSFILGFSFFKFWLTSLSAFFAFRSWPWCILFLPSLPSGHCFWLSWGEYSCLSAFLAFTAGSFMDSLEESLARFFLDLSGGKTLSLFSFSPVCDRFQGQSL